MNMKKKYNTIKQAIKRFFARSEIQLAIFALVLSPISIWMGFRFTEYMAKPVLSVEYVVRVQHKDIDMRRVMPAAAKFGKLGSYEVFVRKNSFRGGFFDFRDVET